MSCCAVTRCRLPKRTFDDVSLPVNATPSQPMIGEKNGNKAPVPASAIPIVASLPLKRVIKPSASMRAIVTKEIRPDYSFPLVTAMSGVLAVTKAMRIARIDRTGVDVQLLHVMKERFNSLRPVNKFEFPY